MMFVDLFLCIVLCIAMIFLQVAGHGLARREVARSPERRARGLGAVEGAVFGLLTLLLGFSFSGAITRFEMRKQLIIAEAVNLGSTYQWVDVLNEPHRTSVQEKMRSYVDERIKIYQTLDRPEQQQHQQEADRLQAEIWAIAIKAGREQGNGAATTHLLASLNDTFDLATERSAALRWHSPILIFVLLFVLAMGCAFLAGYSLAGEPQRHWMAMLAFSLLTSLTIYFIIDIEYPRLGMIRVDDFDALLIECRQGMK
jgi:hypothetical protein